jgi:hypothetical protein
LPESLVVVARLSRGGCLALRLMQISPIDRTLPFDSIVVRKKMEQEKTHMVENSLKRF